MEKKEHRPTPAPRRFCSEIRKYEYENVSIDLINKNLNINSENIHVVAKEKLPNNKAFLGGEKKIHQEEELNVSTHQTSTVTSLTTTTTPTTHNCKLILTEMNNLHASDENENTQIPEKITSEKIQSPTLTPVPAPRKPQNNEPRSSCNKEEEIYENSTTRLSNHSSLSTTSSTTATGAVSKDIAPPRKAPEIPAKTYLLSDHRLNRDRSSRYSISSDISSSSFAVSTSGSYDLNDSHFGSSRIKKSASNNTLNSSVDESSTSSDNSKGSKYKSPAPGYVPDYVETNTKTIYSTHAIQSDDENSK